VAEGIEDIYVKLSAETSQFFGQVDSAVNGATSRLGKIGSFLQSSAAKWGAMIAGAAAGFASWRGLKDAISSTQELGLAVAKLSRETGLSAEESSRLLFAFKHVGLGADDASRSIGIFAKKLKGVSDEETGVTTGGKSTAEILADIGIKATDAAGNLKPIMDILLPLADQFQAMPDSLEKTGLAMQLFGRSGKDMIPLLNMGSEGLKALSAEADKLGVTLSGANVEAIKAFTFAQRDMNEAIAGIKLQLGLAVMPVLTELINWFVAAQPKAREFLDQVIEKFQAAADAARPFAEAAKKVVSTIDALDVNLVDLVMVLSAAAVAFAALNLAADAIDLASFIMQTIQLQMSLATTTTVMASLKAMMLTLPGILMIATAAFFALDFALNKLLGYGFIDWFTGAGEEAKRASAFVKEYGDNTARMTALTAAGATEEQAHIIRLKEVADSTEGLIGKTEALASAHKLGYEGAIRYKDNLGRLAEQLLGLNLTYKEWLAVLEQVPELAGIKGVTDAVDATKRAFIDLEINQKLSFPKDLIDRIFGAGSALGDAEGAAKRLGDSLKGVGQASDALATVVLEKLGGSLERLDLQRRANELEALKTKFGEAFQDQAELDQVNGKLDLLDRRDQAVILGMKIVGERLREAFGAGAQAKIEAIADTIAAMPDEVAIEVLPLLDALAATQIETFLNYWRAGITIPVAFVMAKYAVPAIALSLGKVSGFGFINKALELLGSTAVAQVPKLTNYFGSVAGTGAAAGAAAEKIAEVTDILEDGIISLAEATANGIPAWAAARFEMEAAAAELANGETAWRNQVDLLKMFYGTIDAGIKPALFSFTVLLAAAQGNVEALNTDLGKFISDGVISLTEALEANLTPAQQAIIELTYERTQAEDAAAEATNRGTVELIKLATAMRESGVTAATVAFWAAAQMANEGTLNLVETLNLGLAPAQGAAIQAFSDEIKAHADLQQAIWDTMANMDLFLLQLQDIPGYAMDGVRELYNLGIQLGSEGLGRKALDFELAMREVRRTFGEVQGAAARLAYGLEVDLVNSIQSALGAALGGPTVETANLQVQIDTLQYQLAVQEAAGATEEQTQAIRDQITQLQAQMGVFTSYHRLLQDQATLADQSLPTERELKDIYAEMVGYIRTYSGQAKALVPLVDLQTTATTNAKDQAQRFADVAKGFADYQFWLGTRIGDAAEIEIGAHINLATAAGNAAAVLNSIHAPASAQSGLSYVPRAMLVNVHPEEAILTASEARRWRRGGGGARDGGTKFSNFGRYQVVLPNVRDHADFLREQARVLRGA